MQCITSGSYFKTLNVWFESHRDISGFPLVDNLILHDNPYELRNDRFTSCTTFLSLISDISDLDQWKSGIAKNCMYEIRRAQKEDVDVNMYNSQEIMENSELLKEFQNVYEEMYEQKGMENHPFPIQQIIGYVGSGAFVISSAKVNDATIFHSYVVGDSKVRLMHSCSLFREKDNQIRNAVGRANKYLHWCDVEYFQNKGIRTYDWGGISSFDAPNGIDKFKMAFGGQKVQYYYIVIRKSLMSKLFSLVYK